MSEAVSHLLSISDTRDDGDNFQPVQSVEAHAMAQIFA